MIPDQRRKLIGILGRLGSDHDGERAAAGLLATRLLKSANLGWEQVIPEQVPAIRREWYPSPAPAAWRGEVAYCQQHREKLTPWEAEFLRSISQRGSLSPKQRAVLTRIVAEVGERIRS